MASEARTSYDILTFAFSEALETLDRPALLKLHYDATLVSSPVTSLSMRIHWWDPTSQTWQSVTGGSLDEAHKAVVAPVTRLGTYALLTEWGEPPSGSTIFLPVILREAP